MEKLSNPNASRFVSEEFLPEAAFLRNKPPRRLLLVAKVRLERVGGWLNEIIV